MQFVISSEQPTFSPARDNFRDGGIHFTPLHDGELGTPGYFTMALVRFDDYSTPRHRHNYEQLRVALRGETPIGRTRTIPEGWIAYHPEGTWYGPQDISTTLEDSPVVLAWQFGGPSFSGFLPARELRPAYERLSTRGTFTAGVYRWTDADGAEHHQDGYEAAWGEAVGSPMEYPPSRFAEPVLMNPAAHSWFPTDQPGVAEKFLAAFHGSLTIRLLRLDDGATAALPALPAHRCSYLTSGALLIDGASRPAGTAVKHDPGERFELTADDHAEVLVVDMPDLRTRPVTDTQLQPSA